LSRALIIANSACDAGLDIHHENPRFTYDAGGLTFPYSKAYNDALRAERIILDSTNRGTGQNHSNLEHLQ